MSVACHCVASAAAVVVVAVAAADIAVAAEEEQMRSTLRYKLDRVAWRYQQLRC